MQHAFEPGELRRDLLLAPSARKDIGDCRRRRPFPGSIIRRMRPELADFRSTAPRIQNPHRRFVAEQARMSMHRRQLQLVEALRRPCRLLHPARQRLAIDVEAMAGKDLSLAIKRRAPGELRSRDPGDERGRVPSRMWLKFEGGVISSL